MQKQVLNKVDMDGWLQRIIIVNEARRGVEGLPPYLTCSVSMKGRCNTYTAGNTFYLSLRKEMSYIKSLSACTGGFKFFPRQLRGLLDMGRWKYECVSVCECKFCTHIVTK